MEVEHDDDALTRCEVFETWQVFGVDDQRPLNVGDAPVPGDLPGVRTHETDRSQFDAHVEVSFVDAPLQTAIHP